MLLIIHVDLEGANNKKTPNTIIICALENIRSKTNECDLFVSYL